MGGSDGLKGTNTLLFEKRGWDTILIEPNPEYYKQMVINRPNARCIESACGDKRGTEGLWVFVIGRDSIMSSVTSLHPDHRLVKEYQHITHKSYKVDVDVQLLDQILIDANLVGYRRKLDFVSIDTEGTELDVLYGFDTDLWKPKMLIVENNYDDESIENYLWMFGYQKIERYKINDFYLRLGDNNGSTMQDSRK